MDKGTITLLIAVIFLPLIIYVNYLRLKVFNSADGERYMKQRMQGDFAALSAEETAAYQAREQEPPQHNRRSTDT